MGRKKILVYLSVLALLIIAVFVFWSYKNNKAISSKKSKTPSQAVSDSNPQKYANDPALVGPRGNVPDNAPSKNDFTLFSIPVPGILSRSGQPTLDDFQWLKNNGWKSVIDFREDGEKGNQYALDSKLPGFNNLGFNFLGLPIKDGTNPSNDQADQFLKFVTDPKNQPVHVHCAAGIGRTGIAVALYRYSVQGWPMDKAIEESSLFTKSMNKAQQNWLMKWAQNNKPGSYVK